MPSRFSALWRQVATGYCAAGKSGDKRKVRACNAFGLEEIAYLTVMAAILRTCSAHRRVCQLPPGEAKSSLVALKNGPDRVETLRRVAFGGCPISTVAIFGAPHDKSPAPRGVR